MLGLQSNNAASYFYGNSVKLSGKAIEFCLSRVCGRNSRNVANRAPLFILLMSNAGLVESLTDISIFLINCDCHYEKISAYFVDGGVVASL